MKAASAESGMERNTAAVARMLPRKIRIISPGQHQADGAFMHQVINGRFDKHATDRRPPCVTSCLGTSSRLATTLFDAVDDRDGVGVARPASSTGR